jgi:hypothetical protein
MGWVIDIASTGKTFLEHRTWFFLLTKRLFSFMVVFGIAIDVDLGALRNPNWIFGCLN